MIGSLLRSADEKTFSDFDYVVRRMFRSRKPMRHVIGFVLEVHSPPSRTRASSVVRFGGEVSCVVVSSCSQEQTDTHTHTHTHAHTCTRTPRVPTQSAGPERTGPACRYGIGSVAESIRAERRRLSPALRRLLGVAASSTPADLISHVRSAPSGRGRIVHAC